MEEETNKEESGTKESSDLEKRLLETERLRDDYLDGWKRAKADLSNYKKEEAERMEYFMKRSNEALLHDLIVILDSFELGLSAMREDDPSRKGMTLVRNQLYDTMKRYGLEAVHVHPGDLFNPEIAEAIGEVEAEGPPGLVAEEVTKGYLLHGKTMRPARVLITKEKGKDQK